MRGTDCTTKQLQHARAFINDRSSEQFEHEDQWVELRAGELVRLVAWYGALRYIAGRDKEGGTLEAPGELVVTRK